MLNYIFIHKIRFKIYLKLFIYVAILHGNSFYKNKYFIFYEITFYKKIVYNCLRRNTYVTKFSCMHLYSSVDNTKNLCCVYRFSCKKLETCQYKIRYMSYYMLI